jgi:FkbM family methyltransferase
MVFRKPRCDFKRGCRSGGSLKLGLHSISSTNFSLLGRIHASLYERARFFVQQCNIQRLLESQGIAGPWLDSYDFLQTLTSVRAILDTVPPVLVDVGAHRGYFARAADRVLGFERIICIEPDPELIDALNANVPKHKTTIRQLALSNVEGTADLFIHEDRSMNSLLEADVGVLRTKFPTYRHDSIYQRKVKTKTLDSLLKEEGLLDGPELFLKLDTQGNELNILQAGKHTLRSTRACLVEFMFCTPYSQDYEFHQLIDFLHGFGLNCRAALNIIRRPSHEVSGVDFLFSR